jgi:hypothetical protein
MDTPLEESGPAPLAQSILQTAQLLYPVVLLLAFILSAAVHSIVSSNTEEELVVPTATGPGGKPLPVTKRKRGQTVSSHTDSVGRTGCSKTVVQYLTAAVVLSFVANGAAIAAHALQSIRRSGFENAWWCGEERVVSCAPPWSRQRRPHNPGIVQLMSGPRSTLPDRCFYTFISSLRSGRALRVRPSSTKYSGPSASLAS